MGGASADFLLDAFVDSVRTIMGFSKIHLVGHSAGGVLMLLCQLSRSDFLSDQKRNAGKILNYVKD